MSYDLEIGFKRKPDNLEAVLEVEGFKVASREKSEIFRKNQPQFTITRYNQTGEPERAPLEVFYTDGFYGDEFILDVQQNFVARLTITSSSNANGHDEETQEKLARTIRDRYKAILFDPQADKVIKD